MPTKPNNKRLIDEISKHIAFLGYSADVVEPNKQGWVPMILAKQPEKIEFVILQVSPLRAWCQANFTTVKQLEPGMSDFTNEINKEFLVSRLFFEEVGEDRLIALRVRAIYSGVYNKEAFGQFWDSLQSDVQKLLNLDREKKVFYRSEV
jgi:hypothetical protein